MVFVEGDDYRTLRRPGDDPAQFRSVVRRRTLATGVDAAITDGLVAWYRMTNKNNDKTTVVDETSALGVGADQTAYDATVNGSSFKPTGGVRDVVSGDNPSGAYDHDGVDDLISTSTGPAFASGELTMMCVVNLDGPGGSSFNVPLSHGNGSDRKSIFWDADDSRRGVATDDILVTSGDIALNTDLHIAATFDNDTQTVGYYENGTEIFTQSIGSTFDTASAPIFIGSDGAGVNNFVNGITDNIQLYNRVLSDSEIAASVANSGL
jgi:hypothetical protein